MERVVRQKRDVVRKRRFQHVWCRVYNDVWEIVGKVSPEQKLTFDILKDVYVTRKEEKAKEKKAAEDKEHNEKILALIHEKQEESTKSKSIEELTAMLR